MRKKFKVFLASSSELNEEREAIINHMNSYISCVVDFELIIWEDMSKTFTRNGIQIDVINPVLEDCDVVIILFNSKIGKFTKEELNIALNGIKN